WFLSLDAQPGHKYEHWATLPSPTPTLWQRLTGAQQAARQAFKPNTQLEAFARQIRNTGRQPEAEAWSLPYSHWQLHRHPLVRSASLVNLHWVSGLLDYPSFFAGIHCPVVWTLHDMQPFSGLFHYEGDARQNEPLFGPHDQQALTIKIQALQQAAQPLQWVAPSHWMAAKAMASPVLQGNSCSTIPYSLPLEQFKPQDKASCRQQLGLDIHKNYMLFISKHITTPRKGWIYLHQAMETLARQHPQWAMIVVGEDAAQLPAASYTRIAAGNVSSNETLCTWYNAADVVALPSLEDNLPNTLLEALACGRPILSTPLGGMAAHIEAQTGNGWVAAPQMLPAALQQIMNQPCWQQEAAIRHYAEVQFAPAIQASYYLNLYQQALPSCTIV
ncbi:MAG TPA: glycosyltransferase, partial [Phnomibacter sp.]|nr:glycosyltransferase [Phnomibacter sp.]